jgi:protein N-terminal asparagine amidohydrolase
MVIHELGGSTDTLVSLHNGYKSGHHQALSVDEPTQVFRQTNLLLPELTVKEEDDEKSWYSCTEGEEPGSSSAEPLYLPSDASSSAVDDYLPRVLLETRDELLLHKHVEYTSQSRERLLYVGQGELAHAIPVQCDVLVSDKATTCHILALQSESINCNGQLPLTSLAHIDGTQYSKCVREMIQRHANHHRQQQHGKPGIRMVVHIVGGFNDAKETSRKLSCWLLHLLADVAQEHAKYMTMTLQTCCISSLNDDGRGSPIGRGLAIHTKTGRIMLARCQGSVTGPCRSLRSARLFSQPNTLACIHSERMNGIIIDAFAYESARMDLDFLLSLPDEILIQHTSTSPHCEDDDFCTSLRATLQWMRDVPHTTAFPLGDRLIFKRFGCNQWRSMSSGQLVCISVLASNT